MRRSVVEEGVWWRGKGGGEGRGGVWEVVVRGEDVREWNLLLLLY